MEKEKILFTSESVTEGHPDKMCDQISDAILDELMRQDPMSRVACETCCTTGLVMVMGEITTKAYVDIQKIVRDTVREIGYTRGKYGFDADTCGVLTTLDEQSTDIAMGVDKALEAKENKMSDEDYKNNEQRKSGLKGLASSELFNKILYQTTSMSNALFKFIKEKSKVDIEDLNQLKNILDNIYSNAVDIKIKREAQGKFRYDILRANINDKANKHALMVGITESEKQRSYGLGYALALYGGMRDGYDFEILFNLDTLDQIKNNDEAMAIINKVMILKDLWDKYIS